MIKCVCCGRFISYDDIESNKAKLSFTPESELTIEKIEYTCPDCTEEIARLF